MHWVVSAAAVEVFERQMVRVTKEIEEVQKA